MFKSKFWSSVMSRSHFQLIMRCLRLAKIQPVVSYFDAKIKELYEPDKNPCIDEYMVLWRGRLVFRQYTKGKKHKYVVKLFELCESGGTYGAENIFI